jgi:ABC-type amino acid transport substrate-binding protein
MVMLIPLLGGRRSLMRVCLKRLWRSILVLCLTLPLFEGCYVNPTTLPPPVPAPAPSGTLLNPEFRVGIWPDYLPLAYKFRGQLVGLEVDFAQQLGRDLNKQIVFVETPWPELIPALLAGKIDIIMSGMSVTTERAQIVSFTEPYMHIGQMALVRVGDEARYPDLGTFLNTTARVGFMSNTTGEQAAKEWFSKAKLTPQPTVERGVSELRQGQIDVFIHDAPTVWRYGGNPGETGLVGLYWPLTKEPLAWAVRKSDAPLNFALSRQLREWQLSGRLQELTSRWITTRVVTR